MSSRKRTQAASSREAAAHPLERTVTGNGPARRMHVVLVTMESLGADFLQSFGGRPGLPPTRTSWRARA